MLMKLKNMDLYMILLVINLNNHALKKNILGVINNL